MGNKKQQAPIIMYLENRGLCLCNEEILASDQDLDSKNGIIQWHFKSSESVYLLSRFHSNRL
jgi:hypothetical protein